MKLTDLIASQRAAELSRRGINSISVGCTKLISIIAHSVVLCLLSGCVHIEYRVFCITCLIPPIYIGGIMYITGVCTYIYIYIYIHVCACIYIYIYTCIYVNVYSVCVYIYICIHITNKLNLIYL